MTVSIIGFNISCMHGEIRSITHQILPKDFFYIVPFYENEIETVLHDNTVLSKKHKTFIVNKITKHNFKGTSLESLEIGYFQEKENAIYVYIVGCGKRAEWKASMLHDVVAQAVRQANAQKEQTIVLELQDTSDITETGKQLAIGFHMGQYSFSQFKSDEESKKISRVSELLVKMKDVYNVKFEEGVAMGREIASAMEYVMDLVNTPASHINPSEMVKEAFKIEKLNPQVKVEVLDKDECERLGMGAFLGVAKGSFHEAKFIVMKYESKFETRNSNSEKTKKVKKKLCLIGKSITFDSGGLSLKPSKSMEDMKIDMAGGATVLGVFQYLAKYNPMLPVNIYGILPVCENMPSGNAMRPGDIVCAMDKTTIEVLNTDAEGRLALADALCYAQSEIQPDLIIDLATLTGACMIALGTQVAGVFGNNKNETQHFMQIAKESGDDAWELPLYKPYKKLLKSDIADIKNVGGSGYAGAITAALFLERFIKKTDWIHIDIAGPAYNNNSAHGIINKGATGWGVMSIINLLYASK